MGRVVKRVSFGLGWPHFRGPPRPWKPARSPSYVRPARSDGDASRCTVCPHPTARGLQLAGGPPPAMLLVMHGTDDDGLGRVGQFGHHPEQLQVEILGRLGAAAESVVHERDHRLLTP